MWAQFFASTTIILAIVVAVLTTVNAEQKRQITRLTAKTEQCEAVSSRDQAVATILNAINDHKIVTNRLLRYRESNYRRLDSLLDEIEACGEQ